MKNIFGKKLNAIFSVVLVILSVIIVYNTVFANSIISAGESTADMAVTVLKTEPVTEIQPVTTQPITEKITESETQPVTKKPKPTQPVTTQEPTVPFATAIPPKEPVDYQSQWNAGYLVAIDNPDKTYECAKVTLTDEDRDLLERLCMGEFGSGGFIGAALIAQAVKDAMCFDGFPTVESVIKGCHYTGKTTIGTNNDCKNAVKYIFDENHDAVQHRIMYMYNPFIVQSAFHESQNYIMTYQEVRFFDRWGY